MNILGAESDDEAAGVGAGPSEGFDIVNGEPHNKIDRNKLHSRHPAKQQYQTTAQTQTQTRRTESDSWRPKPLRVGGSDPKLPETLRVGDRFCCLPHFQVPETRCVAPYETSLAAGILA